MLSNKYANNKDFGPIVDFKERAMSRQRPGFRKRFAKIFEKGLNKNHPGDALFLRFLIFDN